MDKELQEALHSVKYCDLIPIIRQCMLCKVWLDKPSELIAHNREKIEYLISHGLCETCETEYTDLLP